MRGGVHRAGHQTGVLLDRAEGAAVGIGSPQHRVTSVTTSHICACVSPSTLPGGDHQLIFIRITDSVITSPPCSQLGAVFESAFEAWLRARDLRAFCAELSSLPAEQRDLSAWVE
ncbi:hypothetical protein [Catellatospora chokoriensis]|uniref:Uncharacterized protein n=1 Tax=Catellatospora chokoriensis TaxID=310353 RepID=A0A8J3JMM2_9ACTN|nr:hypothetical protein [Catellatospora chokoriensis]GIF87632.1 hypothetical protein Cch02nite_10760 [Catellatospora chokoriensis]